MDRGRALRMLNDMHPFAHPDTGLYKLYTRIYDDSMYTDPFDIFRDLTEIVGRENARVNGRRKYVYFPQMRALMKKRAYSGGHVDPVKVGQVIVDVFALIEHVKEKTYLEKRERLKLLSSFKAPVPPALKPFMRYADRISYRMIGSKAVFLKIPFSRDDLSGFAHVLCGSGDSFAVSLAAGGKLFGRSLYEWKKDRKSVV